MKRNGGKSVHSSGPKSIWKQMRFNLLVVTAFAVSAVLGLTLLQDTLLENSQNVGQSLAQSYSVEEERNITVFEMLMEFGTEYLDQQLQENASHESVQHWMSGFFDTVRNMFGTAVIDPYAVVDGEIIAANYWEGDETYDVNQTEWYQKAIAADGAIAFTDAYMDAITGRSVITIAKKCSNSNDVMAFDIFPENFQVAVNPQNLPEGSSYYLCDTKGTLLYAHTEMPSDSEEMQEYIKRLFDQIQAGEMADPEDFIYDVQGAKRGAYYTTAPNGWMSIITVPFSTILGDLQTFTIWFLLLLIVLLLIVVGMSAREYVLNRRIERTNETVRVLGNSYYAIYRVNVEQETYDMIKGSDYIRGCLPQQGAYTDLLHQLSSVIESGTYQEFQDSFSIENIRSLMLRRVRNFGGDFRRVFDQELRWVQVQMLFDESLNRGEVVLCFREIDAEKQQQLQQMQLLQDSLEAARKSEQSQKNFFSSVSHEMRTPLNAILGLTELAGKYVKDAERIQDYLDKIETSSRQLLGLINDILELSRMEQGRMTLDRHSFNLRTCVAGCAEVFRPQAEKEKKKFEIAIDLREEQVYGDSFRVGQILNNLLSNAFKFSGEGDSISVSVRQIDHQKHAKYQIRVSDTGAGMSKEFLERIYIPYERETRFGAKHILGTGLGMPIVKSLVSQMGGEIVVESALGEGTTFTVTLPLEVAQEEPEVAEKKASHSAGTADGLQGKHILLAEDNAINMEIATELLHMHDMSVTQAWNGREAVECFRNSPPFGFDAILMDMQMPEMGGCEAARMIRSLDRPDALEVPILAVTANAFAEDIAATVDAGMNAHISKPIDFEILSTTLRDLIQIREEQHKE